eukprot:989921-Prorocentrum_minimum.AAC.1
MARRAAAADDRIQPSTTDHLFYMPMQCQCNANACQCMPMHANACQCMPIHANACQCMPIHAKKRRGGEGAPQRPTHLLPWSGGPAVLVVLLGCPLSLEGRGLTGSARGFRLLHVI